MISQPIDIDSVKEFTESNDFRLIVKKNKYYEKNGSRPYYCFAIGNCYESANNEITSYDMQYELLEDLHGEDLVDKIEEITGERLYTYKEIKAVKLGAAEDARRGFEDGDILIDDYV